MKKLIIFIVFSFFALYSSLLSAYEKNTIYVYNDLGVSEESLTHTISKFNEKMDKKLSIKKLTAQEVIKGDWTKNAILFVMPGGADLPYVEKLNGKGNRVIKKYVNSGGSFLGICAGSYYASSYVEFDKNGELEVLGDRELKFFTGKAIGPILASYDYKTSSGSRAARIKTIFNNVPNVRVYYNGGGYFENASNAPNTQVIATYENNLPAIILIAYGKGKVLLSGVHFEYEPSLLDSNDPYLKEIIPALDKSRSSRDILFNQLIETIGVIK